MLDHPGKSKDTKLDEGENDKDQASDPSRGRSLFTAKNLTHIATILAIVVPLLAALDWVLQRRIEAITEVYSELISASSLANNEYYFEAAERYERIYQNERAENFPKDLKRNLVTGLLSSIDMSGYPYEFDTTAKELHDEPITTLSREDLNSLSSIYIQIGERDLARKTLKSALSRQEIGNVESWLSKAASYWITAQLDVFDNKISSAIDNYRDAQKLNPIAFRYEYLNFYSDNEVEGYIREFPTLRALHDANPNFIIQFQEFVQALQVKREMDIEEKEYREVNITHNAPINGTVYVTVKANPENRSVAATG